MFHHHIYFLFVPTQMTPLQRKGEIEIGDLPRFLKTLCRILAYRTTVAHYFENRKGAYKMLLPDDCLSQAKFRSMLNCLKPSRGNANQNTLDTFLSTVLPLYLSRIVLPFVFVLSSLSRVFFLIFPLFMVLSLSLFTQMCRAFGKLLLVESAGNYSTDDDKHKARSIKNVEEGFVRKRHSVGGEHPPQPNSMANNATYYSLIHIIFLISLRLGKPWKKQATVMPIITSLKEGLSLSETFLEFLRA